MRKRFYWRKSEGIEPKGLYITGYTATCDTNWYTQDELISRRYSLFLRVGFSLAWLHLKTEISIGITSHTPCWHGPESYRDSVRPRTREEIEDRIYYGYKT